LPPMFVSRVQEIKVMQLGHAEQVIAQREEGGRGHVLVHLIIAVGMNIMHPICHGIVYVVREHDIAWLMWSDTVVRGEEKHAAKVFLRSYFRGSSHLIVLTQPKKPTRNHIGPTLARLRISKSRRRLHGKGNTSRNNVFSFSHRDVTGKAPPDPQLVSVPQDA
jgi:hypothetical protein